MDKSYGQKQTVGYFEVDGRLALLPSYLVAYLQETAINHSDALGYTLDYLGQIKRGWAVVNWHIIIKETPKCRDTITIQTWSDKCKRMQAERSYLVLNEKEEVLIKAISRWIFMDLEERKPIAISEEMVEKYGNTQEVAIEKERYIMPHPKKEEPFLSREFTVTRRDTDTNGHVNNVKYIEWALDDVPDEIYDHMVVDDIRVVYRKECYKGSQVRSKCYVRSCESNKKEVISIFSDLLKDSVVFAEIATQWRAVPE